MSTVDDDPIPDWMICGDDAPEWGEPPVTADHTPERLSADPPDAGMPIEHVIDRDGYVWRVVRDGGMATRAHYAGLISIGTATLERESGPLVDLAAHLADVEARLAQEQERATDLLTVLIADHPMWIDDDGQPLDYLPEREARITDFCREFAAALRDALHPDPSGGPR